MDKYDKESFDEEVKKFEEQIEKNNGDLKIRKGNPLGIDEKSTESTIGVILDGNSLALVNFMNGYESGIKFAKGLNNNE